MIITLLFEDWYTSGRWSGFRVKKWVASKGWGTWYLTSNGTRQMVRGTGLSESQSWQGESHWALLGFRGRKQRDSNYGSATRRYLSFLVYFWQFLLGVGPHGWSHWTWPTVAHRPFLSLVLSYHRHLGMKVTSQSLHQNSRIRSVQQEARLCLANQAHELNETWELDVGVHLLEFPFGVLISEPFGSREGCVPQPGYREVVYGIREHEDGEMMAKRIKERLREWN